MARHYELHYQWWFQYYVPVTCKYQINLMFTCKITPISPQYISSHWKQFTEGSYWIFIHICKIVTERTVGRLFSSPSLTLQTSPEMHTSQFLCRFSRLDNSFDPLTETAFGITHAVTKKVWIATTLNFSREKNRS